MRLIDADALKDDLLSGWCNRGVVKCSECGNTLDMHGVNAGGAVMDLFGICNGECCECTRYICPFGENDESEVQDDA